MTRSCPICQHLDRARLFAEANIDSARLDEFAFASRKTPEYMHHRLWICDQCQLVFANPAPDSAVLEAAYRKAAFDSNSEAAQAARTYIDALRPFLKPLAQDPSALDIGTGDGAFLQELLSAGFTHVRGIEPSLAPINAAKPAIRPLIVQGIFEPGLFPANSFDLVTCFQTIEHVSDPLALCREALELLRPGGMLCLVGHNRQSLSARVLGKRSPIYDIEHLQLFSPKSLRALFETAGYRSVSVHSLWNTYPLAYWSKLFPFPARLKQLVLKFLRVSRIGRLRVSLPAGNLIALGLKPTLEAANTAAIIARNQDAAPTTNPRS